MFVTDWKIRVASWSGILVPHPPGIAAGDVVLLQAESAFSRGQRIVSERTLLQALRVERLLDDEVQALHDEMRAHIAGLLPDDMGTYCGV